jgi:hypothetical protein
MKIMKARLEEQDNSSMPKLHFEIKKLLVLRSDPVPGTPRTRDPGFRRMEAVITALGGMTKYGYFE